jgi:hypothetical protein
MTKSLTLFSTFCLLCSLNLSAQQKSRLGLKSGMNVAWQANSLESAQLGPVISMHFTGFTEVQLANRLFLQPGMSVQGKGMSTRGSNAVDGVDRKVNMLYLEIPINILYKFKTPSFGILALGGGPYAGLGLNGKETNGSQNVFRNLDGSNGYGNTDYGLNFILGTELSPRFSLWLQQSIGLDNVAPEAYTIPSGPADGPYLVPEGNIKNRVTSISIGYKF